MAQVIKKENIVISTGTYQKDGQEKQRYKTIGELVTYQNDDGSTSQFGEMWGPTGSTKFNVYEQTDRNQQQQQGGQGGGFNQGGGQQQGGFNQGGGQQQNGGFNQGGNQQF